MAKCEDKSLKITVKKASATGATKDLAELALGLKIINQAEKKKPFSCDGSCDEGDCGPVLEFQGELQFRPAKLKAKPPLKGYIMGWKCSYKGKATIFCECSEGETDIETLG
jgi:hypothetical protein